MRQFAQAAAGFRLQLAVARRTPAQFLVIVTAPLFSAIFLSLVKHSGSTTHVPNAVIGPGLIAVWAISLDVAASVLSDERWSGRLELLLGTPATLSLVVLGRILAVSVVGMLAFAESWLVARVAFGLAVPVRDPLLLVAALVITAVTSAFTATFLASAFVMSRSLHVYQNSLSYPIYILGGIVVPVAALPAWIGPLSKIVYLSWCADLLRKASSQDHPAGVGLDITMAVGLGLLALGLGVVLTGRFQKSLRISATAGHG